MKILGNPTSGSNFAIKQLRELAKSTSPLSTSTAQQD